MVNTKLKEWTIKLLILINNLNFFCSHRLPIAEAAKAKGFKVVIGYGEDGDANLKLLKQKGFKIKQRYF